MTGEVDQSKNTLPDRSHIPVPCGGHVAITFRDLPDSSDSTIDVAPCKDIALSEIERQSANTETPGPIDSLASHLTRAYT
jgi:hypothetical protein